MCVCIYIYKHWPTLKITYPGVGIEGESGESVRTPTLMMADFLWLCSLGLAPPFYGPHPLCIKVDKDRNFPSKSDSMSVEIGNQGMLAFRGSGQRTGPSPELLRAAQGSM